METEIFYKELSYRVVGIIFDVYNDLGYGYQERYYQKALEKYFDKNKIQYQSQVCFNIAVRGEIIGKYFLDFLIEDKIVLEIKKGNYFSKNNINQVKGYLRATRKSLAIIVNFTPKGVKFFRVLNPDNLQKNNL